MSAVLFGFLSSAYNWPYAALQIPCGLLLDRFGVRRVGICQHDNLGSGIVCGCRVARREEFVRRAHSAGNWRSADIPRNGEGDRLLVSARRTQHGYGDVRFDGEVLFGHRHSVRGAVLVHFGWRANFAVTGIISVVYLALFFLYYRNPSQTLQLSETEREYIRSGGAQPEDPQRAAQGAPLKYLITRRK